MASVLAVLAGVVAACGGDEGDGGDGRTTNQPQEPAEPVTVTDRDMKFMERTIVQQYREEASLTGDYSSDYAADCKPKGEGVASCEITVFQNGKMANIYTRNAKFDPADPMRFKFGTVTSKGGP